MSDRKDEQTKGLLAHPDDEADVPTTPSEEELAASSRLRESLEGGPRNPSSEDPETVLAHALRAAWAPGEIVPEVHAAIVDELPTAEELELATRLRDALEGEAPEGPDASLATALRAAWSPAELPPAEHAAILAKVLPAKADKADRPDKPDGKVVPLQRRSPRVFAATTAVLALAAGFLLWMNRGKPEAETPLARARSTTPLFSEPFKPGETSARIDRIAVARAADYRDNRFAKWGVR